MPRDDSVGNGNGLVLGIAGNEESYETGLDSLSHASPSWRSGNVMAVLVGYMD